MEFNEIDRFYAAKCIKQEVDRVYKDAETEAAIYLDKARDNGQTALVSTFFGEEAGEYKRGRTRQRKVVEYNVANLVEFNAWLYDNVEAMSAYICHHAKEFGQWWFDYTGELADGISRVERNEPPKPKAPQIYRYDHELVKRKLADGGNLLEGANRLLLGDGDE